MFSENDCSIRARSIVRGVTAAGAARSGAAPANQYAFTRVVLRMLGGPRHVGLESTTENGRHMFLIYFRNQYQLTCVSENYIYERAKDMKVT